VSFRIGDIWTDAFTYEKGDKKGQPGASLKGRLLFIGWIKVDGQTVYEAKPREVEPVVEDGEAEPEAQLASEEASEPVAEEQSKPTPAKQQRTAS
jgi:hypothetical protein